MIYDLRFMIEKKLAAQNLDRNLIPNRNRKCPIK
jgi:hypothetical protein